MFRLVTITLLFIYYDVMCWRFVLYRLRSLISVVARPFAALLCSLKTVVSRRTVPFIVEHRTVTNSIRQFINNVQLLRRCAEHTQSSLRIRIVFFRESITNMGTRQWIGSRVGTMSVANNNNLQFKNET